MAALFRVDFVETIIPDGIVSMVSTNKMAKWPDIPKTELIDALGLKHVKLARSDKASEADGATFHVQGEMYVDVELA